MGSVVEINLSEAAEVAVIVCENTRVCGEEVSEAKAMTEQARWWTY